MDSADFDWAYLIEALPQLFQGFANTLWIAAVCIGASLVIGYVGATIRQFNVPVLSPLIGFYVEFIRNTPLLVQIFFWFYGLPEIGLSATATASGIMVLSIWGGAYQIENIRGGVGGVPPRLVEAGRALGLSGWTVFASIILPVATRTVIPAIMNTVISITKNTALLQAIGVAELTYVAMDKLSISYRVVEMFVALLAGYVSLVLAMSAIAAVIEVRLSRGYKK